MSTHSRVGPGRSVTDVVSCVGRSPVLLESPVDRSGVGAYTGTGPRSFLTDYGLGPGSIGHRV